MKKWLCSAGLIAITALSIAACASAHEEEATVEVGTIRMEAEKRTQEQKEVQVLEATEQVEEITEEVVEEAPEEVTEDETAYESMIYSRDWDGEQSYLLAKIAMAEAEGESTEVKALIICTVLNRVWSNKFPNTIEEVLWERTSNGGWQFSPMMDGGRWYTTEPNEDCWVAVEAVMQGWDESYGALYFESASAGEPTWHSRHLQYLFTEGNVKFYKEKDDE